MFIDSAPPLEIAQDLPSFSSSTHSAPKGFWRSSLFDEEVADIPFIYSVAHSLECKLFAAEFRQKYPTKIKATSSSGDGILLLTPGTAWVPSLWTRSLTKSLFFACSHRYDHMYQQRGYYCVGWMAFSQRYTADFISISTTSFDSTKDPRFFLKTTEEYLEVYCHDTIANCKLWQTDQEQKEFSVSFGGLFTKKAFLCHPSCSLCAGIHWDGCPFWDSSDNGPFVNHSILDPNLLKNNPFACPTNKPVKISRPRLMSSIIKRVLTERLVLIEAPPCSGKSTLLDAIAYEVLLNRSNVHAVQHSRCVGLTSPKSSNVKITFNTQCSLQMSAEIMAKIKAISDLDSLSAFLRSEWPTNFEYWIFVDEAQSTYDNDKFWQVLTMDYSKSFYVVAAGSYVGTFSHFSPHYLPMRRRIRLFPDQLSSNASLGQQLCIAFTKDDFDNFVAAASATFNQPPICPDLRRKVMEYASPYPSVEALSEFLHPGVVAELLVFICEQKYPLANIDDDKLFAKFRDRCLTSTNLTCPYALGRCVPLLPAHQSGFPTPVTAVFLKVLLKETILLRAFSIASSSVLILIENTVSHWDESSTSPIVDSSCDLSGYTIRNEETVVTVPAGEIAANPWQRLLDVVANTSTLPSDKGIRPYSIREVIGQHAISDFEQAAHDVRRMGWLLQDAHTPADGFLQLRLPTKWHHEYLRHVLLPRKGGNILQKGDSLDRFLELVVARIPVSTLKSAKENQPKVYEATYYHAFMRAAEDVAGKNFLLPQVGTGSRLGVVDFICLKNSWVIELMRDGIDVEGHLDRFRPGGVYYNQWTYWDWMLVDFHYHKGEPVPEPLIPPIKKDPNYRVVDFYQPLPQVMTAIIWKADGGHKSMGLTYNYG